MQESRQKSRLEVLNINLISYREVIRDHRETHVLTINQQRLH